MLATMNLKFESSVQERGDKLRTYTMNNSIVDDDFILGDFARSKSVSEFGCYGHAMRDCRDIQTTVRKFGRERVSPVVCPSIVSRTAPKQSDKFRESSHEQPLISFLSQIRHSCPA